MKTDFIFKISNNCSEYLDVKLFNFDENREAANFGNNPCIIIWKGRQDEISYSKLLERTENEPIYLKQVLLESNGVSDKPLLITLKEGEQETIILPQADENISVNKSLFLLNTKISRNTELSYLHAPESVLIWFFSEEKEVKQS